VNPIERIVTAIVQAALNLFASLFKGLLGAPATAASRITTPVAIRTGTAQEVSQIKSTKTPVPTTESTDHWIALQGKEIVGAVCRTQDPCPSHPELPWRLTRLTVVPRLRREGIATRLLRAALADWTEPIWMEVPNEFADWFTRSGWQRLSDSDAPNGKVWMQQNG